MPVTARAFTHIHAFTTPEIVLHSAASARAMSCRKGIMGELHKDHQRANRLHLAMFDMQDARRYLDAYAELDSQGARLKAELPHTLGEALIVAAIVAYCRPFSRNQSPGQAVKKLSIDEFWWITNNPTQRALHALIITKRDTFVAHADWDARSTEIVELTHRGVKRTFSDPDVMEDLDPKEFSALALKVEQDCFYQAMALQHRMYTEQGQAG